MIKIGKKYKVVSIDKAWEYYVGEFDDMLGKIYTATEIDYDGDVRLDNFLLVPPSWLQEVKEASSLTGEQIADIALNNSRVFETGSRRDNDTHKPIPMELSPYALLRYGYHMKKGAINYGSGNWELGQPNNVLLESLSRHFTQVLFNYRFPELAMATDDGSDHLAAMIFNIQMLLHNECVAGVPADKYFTSAKQDDEKSH